MINSENLKLIEKLVIYDMVQDLPSLPKIDYDYDISEREIENLCRIASILSLNNDFKEQALAYEIVTKLFKNYNKEYPNLYSISHTILSRLGNFPNRGLLDDYGFNKSTLYQSPILQLEVMARESENQILLQDNELLLTDFQKKFFDVLTKQKFYSVSAPTSAGKSFIFTVSIIQRLIKKNNEKIVLIVPTRALIKELSNKIIKALKDYNLIDKVDVRTVPIVEEGNENKGMVYILTQERLNTLLNEEAIHLDTIFIDEAQEIQSNRGVILQNTLELLLVRFVDINLFFASPLIENPNYFNELLELDFNQNYFVEEVSPVGQNIIFLSSIKRKTKQVKIDILNNDKNIDLGYLDLDFKFRDNGRIIDFAESITKDDELTLIYCNTPSSTETKALQMFEKIEDELDDEDINSLIQFIKEDVHKDYSLIKCLKKGIAYHYSHITATLRTGIEQLASDGKLKYIFCTSTLLQGVNLPTKNIILHKPTKGQGKPMQRSDFLNLIGRAGRLKYEFQGNIWCIEPNEWEEKSYEGQKLQKIESFYIKQLSENAEEILKIAKDETINNMDIDAVFGKFYTDSIIDNKSLDKYKDFKKFKILIAVYDECKKFNIKLPDDIIKKHYTIHPKKLNKLYEFFKSKSNLFQWIPKQVFIKGTLYEDSTYDRLMKIFQKIDEIFLNNYSTQYTVHTLYAYAWIHDKPLSEIIKDSHEYSLKVNPKKIINTSIRESLKTIESEIRFKYVLYSSAYLDILKYVMEEKELDYDMDSIPNLPLHLECGSADPLVINLISLGLSRLTSIKLKKSKLFSCNEPTATNCFNALKNINIDSLDIPLICKSEIKILVE
jgi:replicative superfamily II helicase